MQHWTSGFYVWRGIEERGVDHGYVRGLQSGFFGALTLERIQVSGTESALSRESIPIEGFRVF